MSPPASAVESSVLLIGDAGGNEARDTLVLAALARQIKRDSSRTHVLVLGDNIYPAGLPSPSHSRHAEATARLERQLRITKAAASTLYVPGNHDWIGSGPEAWHSLAREAALVTRVPRTSWLPPAGCPGPAVHDIGRHLRLLVLDSEWWLREIHARGERPANCPESNEARAEQALRDAVLNTNGRRVVVVGHHPPVSGGPHAGVFGWRDHLFPLRAKAATRWLPLPGIGTAQILARRHGVSAQDQSHGRYRAFIAMLQRTLRGSATALYVAGHEHQLGLFVGDTIGVPYIVVSGTGSDANGRDDAANARTPFVTGTNGFWRLDIRADGTMTLTAILVPKHAPVREVHLIDLAGYHDTR